MSARIALISPDYEEVFIRILQRAGYSVTQYRSAGEIQEGRRFALCIVDDMFDDPQVLHAWKETCLTLRTKIERAKIMLKSKFAEDREPAEEMGLTFFLEREGPARLLDLIKQQLA